MVVSVRVLATHALPAPSGAMVYPVICTTDDGVDAVHIFSSREGQQAFCLRDSRRHHVLYDYVLDFPERYEELPH